MIRLILVRHAKSSWAEPGQPDHERPLNDRGRRAAPAIGGWLKARGLVPELGLVSTAVRARQTWAGLCAGMGEVEARLERGLYEATPAGVLAVLGGAPPVACLAVVGHQPGIGAAARRLLADPPDDPRFAKYPTAATTIIDCDAERWAAVGWGTGRLVEFVTPKTLPAS